MAKITKAQQHALSEMLKIAKDNDGITYKPEGVRNDTVGVLVKRGFLVVDSITQYSESRYTNFGCRYIGERQWAEVTYKPVWDMIQKAVEAGEIAL